LAFTFFLFTTCGYTFIFVEGMKKQFISLMLCLVMCIQLLPLTQISTTMYQSQQMNEELPHNDNPTAPSFTEELQKHIATLSHEEQIALTELRITQVIHWAEQMYSRFSDDVETRPPNIV